MKIRKLITEIICFALLLNFFYDGIYKLVHIQEYQFWLKHAAFVKLMPGYFTYTIPLVEVVLAILILIPLSRVFALYLSMILPIIFILYVMSSFLFSPLIFWPFHGLWAHPSWMQKMVYSLLLSWLAFTAIVIYGGKGFLISKSKTLRKTPVNVN
ncbi:MauE/DoxX family redox-associated membrane protein [Flavitalea flava]